MISNIRLTKFLLSFLAFNSSFSAAYIYIFFQTSPFYGAIFIQLIYLAILLGALVACFYLSAPRQFIKNSLFKVKSCSFVMIFILLQSLSLIYSETDKMTSILYIFNNVSVVLVSIICFCYYDKYDPLDIYVKYYVLGTFIAISVFLMDPSFSGSRLGDTKFFHPNSIGRLVSFSLVFLCYLSAKKNSGRMKFTGVYSILFCFFLLILFLSFSKTSIISFLIAFLLFVFIGGRLRFSTIFWSGMFFLLGLYYSLDMISAYIYDTAGGLAFETASGRTLLWESTWEMILNKPLMGYGFNSFRYVGPDIFTEVMPQAHNEILNILFSHGLSGLFIYSFVMVIFFKNSYFTKNITLKKFGISLFCMAIIRGTVESSAQSLMIPFDLYILVLMSITFERKKRGVI